MNGIYIAHYKGEKKKADYLMHYGVKGMKWGHHKAKPPTPGELRAVYDYSSRDIKVGGHNLGNVTKYRTDYSERLGLLNYRSTMKTHTKISVNPKIKKKV